ncbi:hypothetical protein C3R44_23390, partial [Mycobacterium tuberculosis]
MAAVRPPLAAVLGLPPAGAVPLPASLFALGVASLLALALRPRLPRSLGAPVSLAPLLGALPGAGLVAPLAAAAARSPPAPPVALS